MSLSEIIPNALNTINNGIGFLTFGILTTILLFVNSAVGATIFTDKVLTGLDASSLILLISAL